MLTFKRLAILVYEQKTGLPPSNLDTGDLKRSKNGQEYCRNKAVDTCYPCYLQQLAMNT